MLLCRPDWLRSPSKLPTFLTALDTLGLQNSWKDYAATVPPTALCSLQGVDLTSTSAMSPREAASRSADRHPLGAQASGVTGYASTSPHGRALEGSDARLGSDGKAPPQCGGQEISGWIKT